MVKESLPNGKWRSRDDIELKPCPFCGGEAELVWTMTSTPHPYVRCMFGVSKYPKCHGAVTSTYDYYHEEDAIEAWNRREDDTEDT